MEKGYSMNLSGEKDCFLTGTNMQVDKITLNDLSIFHGDVEQSVFDHLNLTTTNEGRNYFRYLLSNPLGSVSAILDTQQTIRHLGNSIDQWPLSPTNGTIMVLTKFYETAAEAYPRHADLLNSLWYRTIHKGDYSMTLFSIQHTLDFLKGMDRIAGLIETSEAGKQLNQLAERIRKILEKSVIPEMLVKEKDKLTPIEVLNYANYIKNHFKSYSFELIDIYAKLDAYMSLAKAGKKYGFHFPELLEQDEPYIDTEELFHFMLPAPVNYSVNLSVQNNFLFLTGANMAGKSTFIKAAGVAVYLAHIGMAVPAKRMKLSYFDGLLSNIQVVDNIAKGESFFFNEVQRIKNTINQISDGRKWLILIDELFKGTNQQDAVKCSTAVIEGLHRMKNAVFILSTHLYEIGESLKKHENIQFRYFETAVQNDQLVFSYQLKEGISNDRLGYLILKREGVVDLLEKL